MDARSVLADPRYVVRALAPGRASRGTLAWLRAAVCRFAEGPDHARRRALVEQVLATLEPAALRVAARRHGDPVAALCAAIGLPPAAVGLVETLRRGCPTPPAPRAPRPSRWRGRSRRSRW